MIITLILFASVLSLIHHLGLEHHLYFLLNQPVEYYVGVTCLLIGLRVALVVYKFLPLFRRIYRFVMRVNSDESSQTVVRKNGNGPFSNGGTSKRQHSTLSSSSKPLSSDGGRSAAIHRKASPKAVSRWYYRSTLLRLKFDLAKLQDWFVVKSGHRQLFLVLKGIGIMAGAKVTSGYIRYIITFLHMCQGIMVKQGPKGLVLYLKATGTMLQQSLGGHVVHDPGKISGPRVSRNRKGLPRWIPVQIRIRIRQGDLVAIRLTLTLINVYRVISFPGTLKLGTITDSSIGTDSLYKYLQGVMPLFVALFVRNRGFSIEALELKIQESARRLPFSLFKGGPGVKGWLGEWNTHPLILLKAFLKLQKSRTLLESWLGIVENWKFDRLLEFYDCFMQIKDSLTRLPIGPGGRRPKLQIPPVLGKLKTKDEPAGKIRVFAMVDAWTQWALAPFHDAIFSILRGIRMDGTFDQTAPLPYVKARRGLWSLDLSAATDRLPVRLQRQLFGLVFGNEFAGHWSNLLVGRVYRINFGKKSHADLKYSVGQPMGALSSWASLALFHHFIVQAAAWRAGFPKWKLYTNYAILGDDIVIGDDAVMRQYLLILDSLGVKCGLHKSLLSHRGWALEFAKKTIVRGQDVSPIAFKEFKAASGNIGAFIELMTKTRVPLHRALSAFGVGWQVRSWLNKPIGKLSARIRLLILALNSPRTRADIKPFFALGQAPVARYSEQTRAILGEILVVETQRILKRVNEFQAMTGSLGDPSPWAKQLADSVVSELDITISEAREHALNWEGMFSGLADLTAGSVVLAPQDAELSDPKEMLWELVDVKFQEIINFLRLGKPGSFSPDDIRSINEPLAILEKEFKELKLPLFEVDMSPLEEPGALDDLFKDFGAEFSFSIAAPIKAVVGPPAPISVDKFCELYEQFLELQHRVSQNSLHNWSTVRPNPPGDRGIISPSQVRFWKRWSKVLQGSTKFPSVVP